MTTSPTPERRPVDGPHRRPVVVPPIAPTDPVSPRRVVLASDSPVAEPVAEPVFEYKKPKRRRFRFTKKWMLWSLAGLLLVVGLVLAFKVLWAVHKVTGNSNNSAPALAGDITKLKGEGDGRVNILLMGIGGKGHEAPDLSDTMMVMSINPQTKEAAMLSIPRDLYVKMPKSAQKHAYYGKINAANAYGGPEASKEVVQTVLGVPIHYYTLVDFSGFKRAIDAVGGVDITVKEALYDAAYPCDNNPGKSCGYRQAVGTFHMNGTLALKYARCRKGTCGNDFGRAARQQDVLVALRNKAMQASTLTNPVKLAGLIDTVGDNVKTDMSLKEMTKLAEIIKDVDSSKVLSKVLDTDSADSLLIGGTNIISGAGYIEVPKLGTYDYSDIHDFVKNLFPDPYIKSENALVQVQNGSGREGLAGTVVKSLKAAGYNVGDPLNAPTSVSQTVLYDYSDGKKSVTLRYLETRFGVVARRVNPTPVPTGQSQPDIVIVLGRNYGSTPTPSNPVNR